MECVTGPCSAGQAVSNDGCALLLREESSRGSFISYENLRAQRAREIDELYTRPFDDIVVEEFISNLPGPTIAEVGEPMEQACGSAEAAPADSPSGEMAGEAKQESDSGAPMETDAPEGSPSGEVSGVKVEEPERTWFPPTAAPDDGAWKKPVSQATTNQEALPLERYPCLI